MGKWTMRSYNGPTSAGCDYSVPLSVMVKSILADGPKDAHDIASQSGRNYGYVTEAMAKLRREGACHIVKWLRGDSGPPRPVYAIGPGEDAPRPKAYTQRMKTKRWRSTPKGQATLKARNTKAKIKNKGLAAVDPLMAVMMGMTK